MRFVGTVKHIRLRENIMQHLDGPFTYCNDILGPENGYSHCIPIWGNSGEGYGRCAMVCFPESLGLPEKLSREQVTEMLDDARDVVQIASGLTTSSKNSITGWYDSSGTVGEEYLGFTVTLKNDTLRYEVVYYGEDLGTQTEQQINDGAHEFMSLLNREDEKEPANPFQDAVDSLEPMPTLVENEIRIEVVGRTVRVEKGTWIPEDVFIRVCDYNIDSLSPEQIRELCMTDKDGDPVIFRAEG